MLRPETGRCAIGALPLRLGGSLPEAELAYISYGQLNERGDNAVLLTHGLTSGHGMLDASGSAEGSWTALLQPGRALDIRHHFVVCSNVLGSALGSTGPASLRPGSAEPWGADFPALTLSDMVNAQKRLLEQLGVRRLALVAGPSYGGMQALQWAADHPDWVGAAASLVSGIAWPAGMGSAELLQRLAADPQWNAGRYARGAMRASMHQLRLETLRTYGMERVLQDRPPTDNGPSVAQQLDAAAARWAAVFDPHALLCLQRAGEHFDLRERLQAITCPVLFATASTDRVFPPDAQVHAQLRAAWGERLAWRVIDTPYGHLASGLECAQWEPDLRRLLQPPEHTRG
jgi:homoserine O-acetyltransferase